MPKHPHKATITDAIGEFTDEEIREYQFDAEFLEYQAITQARKDGYNGIAMMFFLWRQVTETLLREADVSRLTLAKSLRELDAHVKSYGGKTLSPESYELS